MESENVMREVRLEKVVLNIGAGEAGPRLERAKKLLEKLTGRKAVITRTRKRTTFGMARNRPIGCKVTLRGKEAMDFLRLALKAIDDKIKESQFSKEGNFSFGVKEYIDLPGVKYDPEIGLLGFDVCVSLERPGYRVKRRRVKRSKVGSRHIVKREDAIKWAANNLNLKIVK